MVKANRLVGINISDEFFALGRFRQTDIENYVQKQHVLYQRLEELLGSETEDEERLIPISKIADMLEVDVSSVRNWIRLVAG